MGADGAVLTDLDEFADALGLLAGHASSPAGPVGGGADPGRASVGSIYGVPVWLSSQLSVCETQGLATNVSSAYVYDMPAERTGQADRPGGACEGSGSARRRTGRGSRRIDGYVGPIAQQFQP